MAEVIFIVAYGCICHPGQGIMGENGGARLMVKVTRQAVTSIGGFVIIALVAAALIIGGVLFVKHRADVARHDQAVKVADNESQTTNQTKSSDSDNSATKNDSSNNQSHASTDTTTTNSGAGSTTANELPVTGPEDSLAKLIVVAALAISASLYIASRRARSSAL
jgi:cytoskeletal protein RodZ